MFCQGAGEGDCWIEDCVEEGCDVVGFVGAEEIGQEKVFTGGIVDEGLIVVSEQNLGEALSLALLRMIGGTGFSRSLACIETRSFLSLRISIRSPRWNGSVTGNPVPAAPLEEKIPPFLESSLPSISTRFSIRTFSNVCLNLSKW